MTYVYVLDQAGKPLMPTRRYGWVRRSLRDGKAKAVSTTPFTIQLAYAPSTGTVQDVTLGIDPGRTNIGLAAVRDTGECLYMAHCTTRNKQVTKLMTERRQHRHASRRGERLARKRLAKRLGTTMKAVMERKLPGCEARVTVKDIINTEARFSNRKKPEGWLTPTAVQLLRTHMNLVQLVQKILPVSRVSLELNRFSFMELEAGGRLKPEQYQHGPLYGYEGSIRRALEDIQGGVCLLCGKRPIENSHHVRAQSRRGSNTLANQAGLCCICHDLVHKDAAAAERLVKKHDGLYKKYSAVSVLNQIIPELARRLHSLFGDRFYTVYGWETSQFREEHKMKKDHDTDAYCIACTSLEDQERISPPQAGPAANGGYEILQFRRHDRARIHCQTERTYKLGKKTVARNRHKRMDRKGDSLEEWFQDAEAAFGTRMAERMRSSLTVKKSQRSYKDPSRKLPGTIFGFEGKAYILTGQITGGAYYRAHGCGNRNFPAKRCTVLDYNHGLVYCLGKETNKTAARIS